MRRRALLRAGGLAGLASLAGCAGVLGDAGRPGGETPTVNPALDGSPTPPDGVTWIVEQPGVDRVYPAGSAVVAVTRGDDTVEHRAVDGGAGEHRWTVTFETRRSVWPWRDVLVASERERDDEATTVVLDSTTGERLWRESTYTRLVDTTRTAFVGTDAAGAGRTFALFDRRTGERRWRTTDDERVVGTHEDTVYTLTAAGDGPETDPETDTAADTETGTPTAPDPGVVLRARAATSGVTDWRVRLPTTFRRGRVVETVADRVVVGAAGSVLRDETLTVGVVDVTEPRLASTHEVPVTLAKATPATTAGVICLDDWQYEDRSDSGATLGLLDPVAETFATTTFDGASLAAHPGAGPTQVATHVVDGEPVTVSHDPADGEARWRRPGTTVTVPESGPIVGRPESVVAYDHDGAERWRAPNPFDEPFASRVADRNGVRSLRLVDGPLVAARRDGVASYDPTDGTVRTAVTGLSRLGEIDRADWTVADGVAAFAADDRLVGVRL